jgi:transcriptional regulator with XRE-family HTH domain
MTPRSDSLNDIQAMLAAEMSLQLPQPTPDAFMAVVGRHVRQMNETFQVPVRQAELVEAGVLQNSFPAFLMLQGRDPGRASQWVVHTWQDYAEELERLPAVEDKRAALDYDRAVLGFLSMAEGASDGRRILERLMASLGLSQDETGRMFGVSGETIRRWERGNARIPHSRMAALVSSEAALERLESLFVADRLPQVIRRRADLFENERALDLILRGRMAEVAGRYETALAYQG